MTRQLTTLHEHYHTDPRGADSFGRWIEDRVWEMLQRPGLLELTDAETGRIWTPTFGGKFPGTIAECMRLAIDHPIVRKENRRVVAEADGTVIKEWPAKET